MHTRKLEIACPLCHSRDVFYSCTPNCCFNHVCANCRATFETVTTARGGTATGVVPPDPLPEASDPTASCARCGAIDVYATEDGLFVCAKCGTLLTLELTDVAAG